MSKFLTYQSVFSWRYGSSSMREIFSEQHKYELWRKIWVSLAQAEFEQGLVSQEELNDLKKHEKNIDIDRILAIEKETKHDVVAAIKEFAEKAKIGGGKIHLGATSMDIVDNADAARNLEALEEIKTKLLSVLGNFSELISTYSDTVCMAFTHLQPAEPTTVGYRLSFYAQDLLSDLDFLDYILSSYRGKGMKGAVGTAASYTSLVKQKKLVEELERVVMQDLKVTPALIATQVYSRKHDYLLLSVLSSVASSLAKFAGDLRILQSPPIGEWSEPFGKSQVGSSAMPFKKNPINAEKICSLARFVLPLPLVALENATLSYLERTLDDSANRRISISEAFLATDEILITAQKLTKGLVINEKRISYNLSQYAPFAATESILMSSVKKGANRQDMHEILRDIAMIAWQKLQDGELNPMTELLLNNATIKKYLTNEEIKNCLQITSHIGIAPDRAKQMVKEIKKRITQ